VILVVPLGLLGAVVALAIRGMDNNIYTQIGIVLIIALASKNAILIVEFARELRQRGRTLREAAAEAVAGGEWGGGGRSAGTRHGSVRRDDRGHDPGGVLHSDVLRRVPGNG
jgi:hypothetical protein